MEFSPSPARREQRDDRMQCVAYGPPGSRWNLGVEAPVASELGSAELMAVSAYVASLSP